MYILHVTLLRSNLLAPCGVVLDLFLFEQAWEAWCWPGIYEDDLGLFLLEEQLMMRMSPVGGCQ